ncbi:MAG: Bacterial regulatory protein gntR family [Blastocatellia bacterium]|nr:Bacterial regulatory protein gntR family [Blastocatellia bacterium]
MEIKLRVNRKSPQSLTKQITDQLTDLIDRGVMTAGSFVPSERALANTLGVARNVVRGSYEYLSKGGKLEGAGRAGRKVRAKTSRGKTTRSGAAKGRAKTAAARKKSASKKR